MRALWQFLSRAAGATLVVSMLTHDGAQAQQPTPAQTSAIRSSCRSDFMANCSGVQPGGRDALLCLERNVGQLSPACKAAVSAVMPAPTKPAVAVPPAQPAPTAAAPSAPPAATAPEPAKRQPVATAPPTVAPKPVSRSHQPTTAQIAAIRRSCRSDFMAHCPGITPGGKDALLCLQRNTGRLSRSCEAAVAVTMRHQTVPERSPAATAEPMPPPRPAVAPLRVRSFILPRRRLLIVGICRTDVQRLCAGVPAGGEQILKCLGENAASLTPECYAAVARVSIR
jgi:hypothetical protein